MRNRDKNLKLYIIFGIYLLLSFILMINHEIWTDEAQAWEIAKNLSIPQVFMQMRYEAHPCLWYLILMVPAKLCLPVLFMNLISFLITSVAVYIILFKSNLNLVVKVLIILNPVFIYYLSAISRNYCLVLLLLAFFSITYDKRHEKPIAYTLIIAILAHTHLIICGFVGITALIFLIELLKAKEYKQTLISFLILLASFIILALQLFPVIGNCIFIDTQPLTISILVDKIFDNARRISVFFISCINETFGILLLLLILFLSTIITFINDRIRALILFISILSMYIIHLAWPFALCERTAIIFVVIVFLNLDNCTLFYNLFISILSVLIMCSNFDRLTCDLFYDYSDSKNFASYINENVEDNSLIAFIDLERHMSAIPYIKQSKKLVYYNIDAEDYITFSTWRPKNDRIKNSFEIKEVLRKFSRKYKNIYIMYGISHENNYTINRIIELNDSGDIEKTLYQTNNNISIERFGLYKYKNN